MTIAGINPAAAPPSDREKIQKSAEQFEALFVAQILKSAREATATEDSGPEGQVMMEVAEEQIALTLSRQGGLGLARSIVDQLTPAAPVGTAAKPGS